jgi:hypothetical protein
MIPPFEKDVIKVSVTQTSGFDAFPSLFPLTSMHFQTQFNLRKYPGIVNRDQEVS